MDRPAHNPKPSPGKTVTQSGAPNTATGYESVLSAPTIRDLRRIIERKYIPPLRAEVAFSNDWSLKNQLFHLEYLMRLDDQQIANLQQQRRTRETTKEIKLTAEYRLLNEMRADYIREVLRRRGAAES